MKIERQGQEVRSVTVRKMKKGQEGEVGEQGRKTGRRGIAVLFSPRNGALMFLGHMCAARFSFSFSGSGIGVLPHC